MCLAPTGQRAPLPEVAPHSLIESTPPTRPSPVVRNRDRRSEAARPAGVEAREGVEGVEVPARISPGTQRPRRRGPRSVRNRQRPVWGETPQSSRNQSGKAGCSTPKLLNACSLVGPRSGTAFHHRCFPELLLRRPRIGRPGPERLVGDRAGRGTGTATATATASVQEGRAVAVLEVQARP